MFPEPSKWSLSFVHLVTQSWGRLLIWQFSRILPLIDTLHKEGKPQTFIAKEAGCSQSAVSKHVNRKLSGRKKCGRKRCTTNRENRSLMKIVKQNRFKNLGDLHKELTEAGVKASRPTTYRRVKEFDYRGVLPGLRRRRTELLPSGPKSSFQIQIQTN